MMTSQPQLYCLYSKAFICCLDFWALHLEQEAFRPYSQPQIDFG